MLYILEGPCTIGNRFGIYGAYLPAGKFALVSDSEYANGGCGPSTVCGHEHRTRAGAEKCLVRLQEEVRSS